ncbi:MAG: hypothetical protein AB7E05_13375 [Sphingobium sp.]
MSRKLVGRRQRLVRVREAQHAMAVADRLRAEEQVSSIANNVQRISRVRDELFEDQSARLGGSFAAARELATRLEQAGRQLDGALYDARKLAVQKQDRQTETNREKEIALRLQERAHRDNEREVEARIAAIPRYRTMQRRMAE